MGYSIIPRGTKRRMFPSTSSIPKKKNDRSNWRVSSEEKRATWLVENVKGYNVRAAKNKK
jgi:hypothetical protein